jgi:catechol 2,3-dioxygenase-like lactoylglutathione lyase family enzyme
LSCEEADVIKITGVTHWSIPVIDLEESERFYRDLLGLEYRGRLGSGGMACFAVDGNNILLAQRREASGPVVQDSPMHHSFTVDPATFEDSCRLLAGAGVAIDSLVYRARGFFTGRELYFDDPSGNRLELRDATWMPGMPEPSLEEILAARV